jgi:hypothetical protein
MMYVLADGTTETYSYPVDQPVVRAGLPGFEYLPHLTFGVKNDSTGDGRTYDAAATAPVAVDQLQDTGGGLLSGGGTAGYGIVFRSSFMHEVVLHLDDFLGYAPSTVNGQTLMGRLNWVLYSGVLFHLTFPAVTTVCTVTYGGATKNDHVLLPSESLLVVTEYSAAMGMYTHTLTHMHGASCTAIFELSGASTFDMKIRSAGGATTDGVTITFQADALAFGTFSTTSTAASFNKVAAIGARKAQRRYLREGMGCTTSLLSEADDLAVVSQCLEYVEWPQRGPSVLGFEANNDYGVSGNTTDDGGTIAARWPTMLVKEGHHNTEYDLFQYQAMQRRRYVTRSRVDGYNRYTFGDVEFAANGRATVSPSFSTTRDFEVRVMHGGAARSTAMQAYMADTSPLSTSGMSDMWTSDAAGYTKWAPTEFT